jgi:hypothetical protein
LPKVLSDDKSSNPPKSPFFKGGLSKVFQQVPPFEKGGLGGICGYQGSEKSFGKRHMAAAGFTACATD